MNQAQFELPLYLEYGATFIWALSSALLAARRGFAVMGVLTLALVGAAGGGLLRDGLFLQNGPPILVREPDFLWLIALAVLAVILCGKSVQKLRSLPRAVTLFDAIGLGAYAVVGMDRAIAAGISTPGVVVVGMVNAVGGGILRDILLNQEPNMFHPGVVEEAAALAGCFLFLLLITYSGVSYLAAAWLTIALVFAVRIIALRFNISTRPLRHFEAKESHGPSAGQP